MGSEGDEQRACSLFPRLPAASRREQIGGDSEGILVGLEPEKHLLEVHFWLCAEASPGFLETHLWEKPSGTSSSRQPSSLRGIVIISAESTGPGPQMHCTGQRLLLVDTKGCHNVRTRDVVSKVACIKCFRFKTHRPSISQQAHRGRRFLHWFVDMIFHYWPWMRLAFQ